MRKRMNIQLGVAVFLTLSGLVLVFCGFWVAPTGEIHHSVLVSYCEISTFAGALFGVDYTYRFNRYINANNKEEKRNE